MLCLIFEHSQERLTFSFVLTEMVMLTIAYLLMLSHPFEKFGKMIIEFLMMYAAVIDARQPFFPSNLLTHKG